MNEEIHCIANKGKTAKNGWGNYSFFFPALYIVYEKLGQCFFHNSHTSLFKQKYITSVTGYKYLIKLISQA